MSGLQSSAVYDVNTHQTGALSDRDPSIPLNRGVDEQPIGRGPLFYKLRYCACMQTAIMCEQQR